MIRNGVATVRQYIYGKYGADISRDISIQQPLRLGHNEVEKAEYFAIFEFGV
jgi:hypothetical protein